MAGFEGVLCSRIEAECQASVKTGAGMRRMQLPWQQHVMREQQRCRFILASKCHKERHLNCPTPKTSHQSQTWLDTKYPSPGIQDTPYSARWESIMMRMFLKSAPFETFYYRFLPNVWCESKPIQTGSLHKYSFLPWCFACHCGLRHRIHFHCAQWHYHISHVFVLVRRPSHASWSATKDRGESAYGEESLSSSF